MNLSSRSLLLYVVSLGMAFALTAESASAAPALTNVSPRALQTGQATLITLDGVELGEEVRLLTAFPIAAQELQPAATANRVQLKVTLDANLAPGIYWLRAVSPTGVSNPIAISIDGLPTLPFTPEVAALPVALVGDLQGSAVLRTSFQGAKDQRLLVDVEGRRLGSNLRPVLRLYDARGTQLAWSPSSPTLGGDARLECVLPQAGTYTLEMHDLLYRGGSPGFFRLKLGDLKVADFVLPLAAKRGAQVALEPIGLGLPADLRVSATANATSPFQPAGLTGPGIVGPQPRFLVSDDEEALEAPQSDASAPQPVPAAPVGISGRLAAAGEEDRFLVPVVPGAKLRIEVVAERLGSPVDAVLAVRGPQGNQLAAADDLPNSTDAGVDFTVPAGMDKIQVAVKDMLGRGGPGYFYHLEVTRSDAPDFTLSVDSDRIPLVAGGSTVYRVAVDRDGYQGPIRLRLPGLPSAVQVAGAEIPGGAEVALLTLTAPADLTGGGLVALVGEAAAPSGPLVRVAEGPDSPVARFQPWLRSELAYGVLGTSKLEVAWANPAEEDKLVLGSSYTAKVAIKRAAGVDGAVRLSLVTSQVPPKKAPAPKPKRGRRPANAPADDLEQAIRLEGLPQAAAGASEATGKVLVPLALPAQPYDLVIRADLLAADGQTVVSSAWTTARRFGTQSQIGLELTVAPNLEAKINGGPSNKLTGKIVRYPGFNLPVSVTFQGLPKEIPNVKVDVPADKTDFEIALTAPNGAAAGELSGVKLVATAQQDANNPATRHMSAPLPLSVKIVPAQ